MKTKKFLSAFAVCILVAGAVVADTSKGYYAVTTQIDWKNMTITFDISLDIAKAGLRMPSARIEAERLVERDLPGIARETAMSLLVDSHRTVLATLEDGTIAIEDLLGVLDIAVRTKSGFTPDLERFETSFDIPLSAIASLYVKHTSPTPMRSGVGYTPSKQYSGIVIYAKGELPVKNEFVKAKLATCFFPRIFDSEMNLVLERNAVSPESIRKWGVLAYSESLDLAVWENRIGGEPLKIIAEAIFGTNRTDIVISREDALAIFGRPENAKLITEGRILVIIDSTKS